MSINKVCREDKIDEMLLESSTILVDSLPAADSITYTPYHLWAEGTDEIPIRLREKDPDAIVITMWVGDVLTTPLVEIAEEDMYKAEINGNTFKVLDIYGKKRTLQFFKESPYYFEE